MVLWAKLQTECVAGAAPAFSSRGVRHARYEQRPFNGLPTRTQQIQSSGHTEREREIIKLRARTGVGGGI